MKHQKTLNLFAVALISSLGIEGCVRKKPPVTPVPALTGNPSGQGNTSGPIDRGTPLPQDQPPVVRPANPEGGVPLGNRFSPDQMNQDRDRFAANTVYFAFDRATIKPGETSKIDDVAKYLQANATHAVQIEGHCDERGTEQYNLSLGERRALSVREYLVNAGVQPERVFTISYGESRPAETGHNEAAWSKNRRGVFVLLTPK